MTEPQEPFIGEDGKAVGAMTMIERVAQTIRETVGDKIDEGDDILLARAAIEAMRGYGKLAAVEMHERSGRVGWASEYECECFDMVIDAALSEKSQS